MTDAPSLWSIGHGNRSIEDLIELLRAHAIDEVADVRRVPFSRRHPHVDRERLAESLTAAGIGYLHLEALGGRREPDGTVTNAGIHASVLRGYADYMAGAAFAAALEGLIGRASARRAAMMCAESDPRHCHRSMIADALTARGVAVHHILGAGVASPHVLTHAARIADGRVTYPPTQGRLAV